MKFRKKPVVIEAFRLPSVGENPGMFCLWAEKVGFDFTSERDGHLAIQTLEGEMLAAPGDWIIKGVAGEFYPCKNEIFEKTYERTYERVDG